MKVKVLKSVPWLTVLVAALGATAGVNDFIRNNDVMYLGMLASGTTPTVPATYWVFGGWKAGLLNATVWLSLPYVLTGMLIVYLAATGKCVRSVREAVLLFAGGALLYSGMWDAAFMTLVLNYWDGGLLGESVAWLPIAVNPDGSVAGISFTWGFGVWFTVVRVVLGVALLLPVDWLLLKNKKSRRVRV